jgi:rod shape-determining protein MreD
VLDSAKAAVFVFVAAILQVSVFSSVSILHGTPDLLLVTIICVALLRGPVTGAVAGFWGGLLLDTANLDTLGVTSLLLTLAGYWIGRYGETTGRDRAHAPFVSVAVVTLLYAIGSLAFHYVLGDPAPARAGHRRTHFPGIALNQIQARPVHALGRLLLPSLDGRDRIARVHALG